MFSKITKPDSIHELGQVDITPLKPLVQEISEQVWEHENAYNNTLYRDVYNRRHRNSMVHFCAERLMNMTLPPKPEQNLKLAKKLLDLCWYVGITELLDHDLPDLFSAMGLPTTWKNYRVAGQPGNALEGLSHPKDGEVIHTYYTFDDAMRQHIYTDHPHEVQLYEYALQLHNAAQMSR